MRSTKLAVVTGASKGIGREIALEFTRNDFHVAACSRTRSDLSRLEQEISSGGGSVITQVCDISREEDVIRFFDRINRVTDKIDVLVNNAAVAYIGPVEDTSLTKWEETINVNLTGTFLMCKHALGNMDRGSQIFNIGSNASKIGFPNWSAYCASKFGLLGFSNSLRAELRPRGIKVTAILPGPTKTSLWKSIEGEWDETKMMSPRSVAEMIMHIYKQPAEVQTEEVFIIPASGGF